MTTRSKWIARIFDAILPLDLGEYIGQLIDRKQIRVRTLCISSENRNMVIKSLNAIHHYKPELSSSCDHFMCINTMEIVENILSQIHMIYPKFRYIIEEAQQKPGSRGYQRVYINKKGRKITTKHAKKFMFLH